ncbi:universal stress protein [Staphylococcus chromogenes]|nr:universal stress protein [Staphylococcus chromogenes]
MKLVVGYEATPQGIDALALANSLAELLHAQLDIVVVLRRNDIFSMEYPPTGGIDDIVTAHACRWLKGALEQVNNGIEARGRIVAARSTSQGLIRAAEEAEASMIVVGGASTSPLKRHQLGSVATDLLYSSPVPVALAPRGYYSTPITRLNCAVGTRPGAGSLVREGIVLAEHANKPLRLVALLDGDSAAASRAAEENTQAILAAAQQELGVAAAVDIAVGQSTEVNDAISHVGFDAGDILFVGSSRVEQKHRVFLGSLAMRILRVLTVPLVVVPRGYVARREVKD